MSVPSSLAVSVVIPTFNGLSLIKKHLPAVLACLKPSDEVIIIDDAGTDNTFDWLIKTTQATLAKSTQDFELLIGQIEKLPIKIIKNHQNLRFARSCNRAVELATNPLIWLLNNDVQPEPTALSSIRKYFTDPLLFAVGCHEIEPALDNISGGKKKLWFSHGLFHHSRAAEFSSGPTDWVSGGSAVFDKEKWVLLGGFDPIFYPAYWEDVDLCYRATLNGWKMWFETDSIVYHNHESTNQSVFGQLQIDQMSWKHGLLFTWKNGTWSQRVSFLVWQPYWWVKRWRYRHSLLAAKHL